MSEGQVLVGEGMAGPCRVFAMAGARTTVCRPRTRVLLDDQATETETNVRTIERPLILHMATHGFFGEARDERDEAMFRSGLDREHDDGQLTAYEVSGMDLRGTQLVVLSACDTWIGAEVMAEGKVGAGEAMQAVQLEMLRTNEQAHPKDWAVFIVSGDDDPFDFPAGQAPRAVEDEPPRADDRGGARPGARVVVRRRVRCSSGC